MESLFFIPRYMGSDDEDEDGNQQVSTNKLNKGTSSSPGYNAAFASKKQQRCFAQESDSVMEIGDSNCSSSGESSDASFVDSETKSKMHKKRKISKSENCSQNIKEKRLPGNISKNINSYIEIDSEIQILDHCSNSIKNSTNNSFDISEKSSSKDNLKMFDNLNSSVETESEIEVLNDSNCSGFIQNTQNKSSNFKEENSSCMEPLKKKRKQKENELQDFNLSSFQDSKVINENSCSFTVDTSRMSETTDLKPRRAKKMKKMKMENSEQIQNNKEKSDGVDLVNVEVMDQETKKNEKEKENGEAAFPTIGQVQHQKDISCTKTLPYWLTKVIHIDLQKEKTPITEFNELDSIFKNNLIESGIQSLVPVQSTVLPVLMKNYVRERRLMWPPADICVCAPTGSGKTLTFVLPIVQALKERVIPGIRALIVLPVSELAIQVYKVFKSVIRGTDLKVALLIGQKSFRDEQLRLIRFTCTKKALSLVDIIVTTPGRIRDHIYRTDCFCLKFLRYLVIDEADRMMEEIQRGWLKQIEEAVYKDTHSSNCVCSGRPTKRKKSTERTCALDFLKIQEPLQKLLCSATLTHDPEQLHSLSLYKPKLFTASASNSEQTFIGRPIIPDKLTTLQVICVEGIKPMVICHLIKQHQFKRVLCFAESVERTHKLNLLLEAMGLQVREISSIKKAVQRKIVLKQFAAGRVNVLVCSDLLTRGIDITDVDCVISYDVPQCDKMYVHRIGRTARAGKSGIAITLLSEGEIPHFKKILKLSGLEIPDTINIQSEDLKPLLKSYQVALSEVNVKLRSKNHERFNKKGGKNKKSLDQKGHYIKKTGKRKF